MINNERVRLMTRMSVYEEREGARDFRIFGYFRADYIVSQMLHSFVTGTMAFLVLLGVYGMYNFEDLILSIYSVDLTQMLFTLITRYVVFMAVFFAITFLVYNHRYSKTRNNLARYARDLKKLDASYKREEERS